MRTTKTRTTIAALAAVLSVGFASAPIVQDASATKNDHRYSRSAEAKRHNVLCSQLQSAYEANVESAVDTQAESDEERAAGNIGGANWLENDAAESDKAANDARKDAKKQGCKWAKA